MNHLKIQDSPVGIDLKNFTFKGEPVIVQHRSVKDISAIFLDQEAAKKIPMESPAYQVQVWMPVAEGTMGGLFFGTSTIMPGKVGNEYMMTRGHFHTQTDRAEFYWGVLGQGMLILMDRDRNTWAEKIYPGSLHYIGADIAHRLANTGHENLVVGACWPSDAGHDYGEIVTNGFSARLLEIEGKPTLV